MDTDKKLEKLEFMYNSLNTYEDKIGFKQYYFDQIENINDKNENNVIINSLSNWLMPNNDKNEIKIENKENDNIIKIKEEINEDLIDKENVIKDNKNKRNKIFNCNIDFDNDE